MVGKEEMVPLHTFSKIHTDEEYVEMYREDLLEEGLTEHANRPYEELHRELFESMERIKELF
jgi:hypothetical protein